MQMGSMGPCQKVEEPSVVDDPYQDKGWEKTPKIVKVLVKHGAKVVDKYKSLMFIVT